MNKLNGIVVENLSLEFGQELKKTFEELGVDVQDYEFVTISRKEKYYYGIVNGLFRCCNSYYVEQSNAKIITLEELKSMKNPYPKMMYVNDVPMNSKNEGYKYEVYFEKELEGHIFYFAKAADNSFYSFKYAVDLNHFDNQVKEITIEEIAQRFGYPIEQIRIKK